MWEIHSPDEVLAIRHDMVDRALRRTFGDAISGAGMKSAADLARRAIEGCQFVGRPLYAAYAELPWPDEPHMSLWHACTLFREHRGDSHNIALGAAGLDGVECHLLMAAKGHGNRDTILAIRGWTEEEWEAANSRLMDRDLVTAGGAFTEAGRAARSEVERHTDQLASEPVKHLGSDDASALVSELTPLVKHLMDTHEVSGVWPPPHLVK